LGAEEIGQLVGGVWLPKTELHLADMMLRNGKKTRYVDGLATYQYAKLEAALAHVANRKLAIDVGGHVGLWSMWLVKEFERVVAFEPVPEHAALFLLNVDMAKCDLRRHALGDVPAVVDIEIPLETTGNAHVAIGKRHPGTRHVPHPDAQRVVHGVEVKTLDSLSGLDDVGFIKIDVEGFERQVVAGGKELICRAKPIMIVEQKKNESAYGHEEDAARKLLESWGMKSIAVMAGDWIMGW
jgi:FkbM family methyltransferase